MFKRLHVYQGSIPHNAIIKNILFDVLQLVFFKVHVICSGVFFFGRGGDVCINIHFVLTICEMSKVQK
jgi:hypothetical protein